jgi:hypothetical protein
MFVRINHEHRVHSKVIVAKFRTVFKQLKELRAIR